MFNLTETIRRFNQAYQERIKLNKTWGLVYLQSQSLDFLNKCMHLIQESVYHASPFTTNRRALRATFAKTQDQPTSEALPVLKTIVQQLQADELIRQRLDWEEHLQTVFNAETFWQQNFSQVENNSRAKRQLKQLYQDWKQHQPFQYYSSQGLLFLLDVVVKYQYHFTQAHQELERKQQAWLSSQRLPGPIAESYSQFLESQLNYLKALQNQVVEALLQRLKIAEQQNQVTCDDVSYALVEQSQLLNLPLSLTLPKHQRTLDATTFNQMHRAIEKYGNPHHKNQLYRLAWYHSAEFNVNKDITLSTVSGYRLLVPTVLLSLIPKKARKPAWLFRSHQARLTFLEKQQALLAQLVLPLDFTPLSPNSLSTLHLTLKPFILRYQLLQASLQSLEQQPAISWWQWRQKRWKKAWYTWLTQHFRKNQENLRGVLNHFSNHLQTHKEWLGQAAHRQPIHDNLMYIQQLIDKSPHADCCPRLTFLIKHLLAQWQTKAEEIAREKQSRLSLSQNFKQNLMSTLESYVKYCREQGRTIPEARLEDINYLRNLLNTTDDLTQLRESVVQRYQIMQRSWFAKLTPSLDGSLLRHGLRSILENPQYSTERLNLAITSLASSSQKILHQEDNLLSIPPLEKNTITLQNTLLKNQGNTINTKETTFVIQDANNNELFMIKQQLAQIQIQIHQLLNVNESVGPFIKSPNIVSNHFRFFNAPQGIKPIN